MKENPNPGILKPEGPLGIIWCRKNLGSTPANGFFGLCSSISGDGGLLCSLTRPPCTRAPSHPHGPSVTFHPFASLGSRGERLSHCHRNTSEIFDAVIRPCSGHRQRPARTPRPPGSCRRGHDRRYSPFPGGVPSGPVWGSVGKRASLSSSGFLTEWALKDQTQYDRWLKDRSSRMFLSPRAFAISRKGSPALPQNLHPCLSQRKIPAGISEHQVKFLSSAISLVLGCPPGWAEQKKQSPEVSRTHRPGQGPAQWEAATPASDRA